MNGAFDTPEPQCKCVFRNYTNNCDYIWHARLCKLHVFSKPTLRHGLSPVLFSCGFLLCVSIDSSEITFLVLALALVAALSSCHLSSSFIVAAFSIWLLGFHHDDANPPTYAFSFWFWAAAAAAAAVAAAAVAADADWFGRSLGGK